MSWVVNQGDYGITRTMTITNYDGSTKNISGDTATLYVYDQGGDFDSSVYYQSGNVIFNRTLVVASGAGGVVQYTFASGDTNAITPQQYPAVIKLNAAGYQESTNKFTFIVNGVP